MHELCHWLVADETVRDRDNFGIEDEADVTLKRHKAQEAEEKMCGFVADVLYAEAGVIRPHSSVDDANYKRAHRLKSPALAHLAKLSVADRTAIVAALRLPGGDHGVFAEYSL